MPATLLATTSGSALESGERFSPGLDRFAKARNDLNAAERSEPGEATVEVRARSAFLSVKRVEQPAPAPRFSRTAPEVLRGPPERGEGGAQALADWGFDAEQVKRLGSLGLGFGEKK